MTKDGLKSASVELELSKNLQARQESLWDITSVGCTTPNIQASLWNRSTDVVTSRYTASMTADAVLCSLNCFFEELDMFSDWLQQFHNYESHP